MLTFCFLTFLPLCLHLGPPVFSQTLTELPAYDFNTFFVSWSLLDTSARWPQMRNKKIRR